MNGIELITAERKRQIEKEDFSTQRDIKCHVDNQLVIAAICYAFPHEYKSGKSQRSVVLDLWPWDRRWYKPGDRIRELSKAGALIAAEIDRLLAIEAKTGEQEQ